MASLQGLEDRRINRGRWVLGGLGAALACTVVASLGYGALAIAPTQVLTILADALGLPVASSATPAQEVVLLSIRLPRVLLGLLTGMSLAVAGAAFQGLFRNPLADPALIGVSSGAGAAAVVAIVFAGPIAALLPSVLAGLFLPLAAFGGGLVATITVYTIATRDARTDVATLLLAGVAINAVAGAVIGVMVFISNDQQLRDLNFWLLGSLGGGTWDTLLPAMPLIAVPALLVACLTKSLNALLLGERDAMNLGYAVESIKRAIVFLAAMSVGAAVALTGTIGFVGLVVPHLIRLAVGPDHRVLLPACVLLGPTLLLAADLLARTLVLPAELPIGIVTSCVGGPFFLWLLMRRRGSQI